MKAPLQNSLLLSTFGVDSNMLAKSCLLIYFGQSHKKRVFTKSALSLSLTHTSAKERCEGMREPSLTQTIPSMNLTEFGTALLRHSSLHYALILLSKKKSPDEVFYCCKSCKRIHGYTKAVSTLEYPATISAKTFLKILRRSYLWIVHRSHFRRLFASGRPPYRMSAECLNFLTPSPFARISLVCPQICGFSPCQPPDTGRHILRPPDGQWLNLCQKADAVRRLKMQVVVEKYEKFAYIICKCMPP